MSSTILHQSIQRLVNNRCREPEFVTVVTGCLQKLQDGYYNQKWIDVICQKWDGIGYTIYDAYAFSQVWSMLCLAKIVCAEIVLGESPHQDKDILGNNALLDKLGGGFHATFWGGNQDHDGEFVTDEPIGFDMQNLATGDFVVKNISGRFPLEVGYTVAEKTLAYLSHPGHRLARWPYRSKSIYLLYNTSEN